eukprot:TRINITY_DN2420_c0_g1_i1.p1 TRINITY_DN2420_c0_g1~~TRINITY_DN2420_c0_g1_i1.p1  ORF type:complete len:509 (+),score=131.58 TRINITY_DN2420_c0_g1_i1:122-1648(+)
MAFEPGGELKITLTRASSGTSLASTANINSHSNIKSFGLPVTLGGHVGTAGHSMSPRLFSDHASVFTSSNKSACVSPANIGGMPERLHTVEQGLQKLHGFCSNLKKVSVSLTEAMSKLEKKLHGDVVEEMVTRRSEIQELGVSERAARQEHASSVQKLLASEKAARASHEGMIRGLLGSQEVTFLGHLSEQRKLQQDLLEERAGRIDEEVSALRERMAYLEAYLQASLGERKNGSLKDALQAAVEERLSRGSAAAKAFSAVGDGAASHSAAAGQERSALMELLAEEKAAREHLEEHFAKQLTGLGETIRSALTTKNPPAEIASEPASLERCARELEDVVTRQQLTEGRVQDLQAVVDDIRATQEDDGRQAVLAAKATKSENGTTAIASADVVSLNDRLVTIERNHLHEMSDIREQLKALPTVSLRLDSAEATLTKESDKMESFAEEWKKDYGKMLEEMLCVSSTLGMLAQERKAEEKRLWEAIDTHTHDLSSLAAVSPQGVAPSGQGA